MEQKLQERAEEYARVLTEKCHAQWSHSQREVFAVQQHSANQKFVRIISDHGDGRGGSVHSFINTETGGVHKAGGWTSPARDRNGKVYQAKYNLLDDDSFKSLLFNCDIYGTYLYAGNKPSPVPADFNVEKQIEGILIARISRDGVEKGSIFA